MTGLFGVFSIAFRHHFTNECAPREFYKHDLGQVGMKNDDFDWDDDEVLERGLPRVWKFQKDRKWGEVLKDRKYIGQVFLLSQ